AYSSFRTPARLDAVCLQRLSAWFRGRLVRDLRHADLVEAAAALYPGGAAGTRNRHVIGPAAAGIHYAAEQGWCDSRRFQRFREPRRSPRKPAPDTTMQALISATEGHRRLLLSMLYETGLRISDLLRLTEGDLDLSRGAILVHVSKTKDRAKLG